MKNAMKETVKQKWDVRTPLQENVLQQDDFSLTDILTEYGSGKQAQALPLHEAGLTDRAEDGSDTDVKLYTPSSVRLPPGEQTVSDIAPELSHSGESSEIAKKGNHKLLPESDAASDMTRKTGGVSLSGRRTKAGRKYEEERLLEAERMAEEARQLEAERMAEEARKLEAVQREKEHELTAVRGAEKEHLLAAAEEEIRAEAMRKVQEERLLTTDDINITEPIKSDESETGLSAEQERRLVAKRQAKKERRLAAKRRARDLAAEHEDDYRAEWEAERKAREARQSAVKQEAAAKAKQIEVKQSEEAEQAGRDAGQEQRLAARRQAKKERRKAAKRRAREKRNLTAAREAGEDHNLEAERKVGEDYPLAVEREAGEKRRAATEYQTGQERVLPTEQGTREVPGEYAQTESLSSPGAGRAAVTQESEQKTEQEAEKERILAARRRAKQERRLAAKRRAQEERQAAIARQAEEARIQEAERKAEEEQRLIAERDAEEKRKRAEKIQQEREAEKERILAARRKAKQERRTAAKQRLEIEHIEREKTPDQNTLAPESKERGEWKSPAADVSNRPEEVVQEPQEVQTPVQPINSTANKAPGLTMESIVGSTVETVMQEQTERRIQRKIEGIKRRKRENRRRRTALVLLILRTIFTGAFLQKSFFRELFQEIAENKKNAPKKTRRESSVPETAVEMIEQEAGVANTPKPAETDTEPVPLKTRFIPKLKREPAPEPVGDEPDLTEAAEENRWEYERQHKSLAGAFAVAFLSAAPFLWESVGVSVPFWSESLQVQCVYLLVMLSVSSFLCMPVLEKGVLQLIRGRFTAEFLMLLAASASVADCLVCVISLARSAAPPYVSVICLVLAFALWGVSRENRGNRDMYRSAAVDNDPPYLIAETISGACKHKGKTEGFYTASQKDNIVLSWQAICLPIIMLASMIFAFMSSFGQNRGMDFFLNWSAMLTAGATCTLSLCWGLPWSRLSEHLMKAGCAVAGWHGAERISHQSVLVLTDTDLFPMGTIQVRETKTYGLSLPEVYTYAASLAHEAGSGLELLFDRLLRSEMGTYRSVEHFSFYQEGGWGGSIDDKAIYMGNARFMQKLNIFLPDGVNRETDVFLAVDSRLAAAFHLDYQSTDNVRFAMKLLKKSRLTILLAVRDFNITPEFIRSKFSVKAKVKYPQLNTRIVLSGAHKTRDFPRALIFREGLLPYAEAVIGSRRLRSVVNQTALLSILGSTAGLILTFYLTSMNAYSVLNPVSFSIFLLLWTIPTLLLSRWVGKY